MSTFMIYTYPSSNFRSQQGARPFYDPGASVAAEEFGHIELVSAAVNTIPTGVAQGAGGEVDEPLADSGNFSIGGLTLIAGGLLEGAERLDIEEWLIRRVEARGPVKGVADVSAPTAFDKG